MPQLFCPREVEPADPRVALTPETARRFMDVGIACAVEEGAGRASGFPDAEYAAAGCHVEAVRSAGLARAGLVVSVHPLPDDSVRSLNRGAVTVSFLDPFRQRDKVVALARAGVTALSLEMVPRTTVAQKMDGLSSQASLAGYASVLLAAMRLDKVFPMMMTPAGTLQPSRVLVVGVGVAGLQAIATAKRLGARVTAFDTRPAVEEQVRSLGAKFLHIDLGATGQTGQGYAKELTAAQIELQRKGMARACAESDVVITTAQVFGKPAPRLITRAMLEGMRPGSVVVDLAVATGGNVEGSQPGQEVLVGGVRILGADNLPASVPHHASTALANNIFHLVAHCWSKDEGLDLRESDEIVAGALLARDGVLVHPQLKQPS